MEYHKVVVRPDHLRLPSVSLPLYLRSVGHYRFAKGREEKCIGNQKYVQIFWGVEGAGELIIAGEKIRLKAGDVAFKFLHERHSYQADSDLWELRWVVFDGPQAQVFLNSYSYPRVIRNAGICPHDLFMEFEAELRETTPYRQRKLISTLTEILALAGGVDEVSTKHGRIVQRFIEEVRSNYFKSSINVSSFADKMGIHRTTLARVFKERMHISPLEYLSQHRMRHALDMLRNTDLPISDIAVQVGVPDPTYFSRCVKKVTGYGPREYRSADGLRY